MSAADISLNGHSWAHLNSFPSGHMAITAALAVSVALAFPRLRYALWAYVAAVAFTRVLFGAHFPLDVVAGTALGTASALLVVVVAERVRRRRQAVAAETTEITAEPLPAGAVAAVMPSHNDVPTRDLVEGVREHVGTLVIVDDGSDPEIARQLDELAEAAGTELVRRPVRGGKGSAVRTGIDHVLARETPPEAVLVIDADGQHPPARSTASSPLALPPTWSSATASAISARCRYSAGWRTSSRAGLFQLVTGRRVRDTQNGMRLLRGRALATLPTGGYEAETRHLKRVLREGLPVSWVPIPAIYADERSSFRPGRDSARVIWAIVRPAGPTQPVASPTATPSAVPASTSVE